MGGRSEGESKVKQGVENQNGKNTYAPVDSILLNQENGMWQSYGWRNDSVKAILLFLDPQGAGEVPLKKYIPMAKKNGWALFGSSRCKNGLSSQQGSAIIQDHVRHLRNLGFPKAAPLVLCGFSGGARQAFFAAQNPGLVEKLIYIGAGGGQIHLNIPVLGFAGNQDMNFAELVDYDGAILPNISHFLLETNDRHAWPTEEDFAWVKPWIALSEKSIETLNLLPISKVNDQNLAVKGNRIAFLAHLEECSGQKKIHRQAWEKLKKSHPWKELMQRRRAIQMEELKERQRLAGLVFYQSLDSWKQMVYRFKEHSDPEILVMNKRLLGYMSLLCYSYIQSYWQSNEANQIIPYLTQLYQIVDPENPEGWFIQARWESRQPTPNIELLISALQMAKNKGFTDWDRLNTEPEFSKLISVTQFQSFRASIGK